MAKKGRPGAVALGGKQSQSSAAAQPRKAAKQASKEPVQPPPEDEDFEVAASDDEDNDDNDSLPSSGPSGTYIVGAGHASILNCFDFGFLAALCCSTDAGVDPLLDLGASDDEDGGEQDEGQEDGSEDDEEDDLGIMDDEFGESADDPFKMILPAFSEAYMSTH
jgi:hypothetical protein